MPFFIIAFLLSFLPIITAQAVCPVCAIAVGFGIGLSRWLGIDDVITGLWIGGLLVSLIAWTVTWLNKKNIRFYGRKILVTIFYFAITLLPLYKMGVMGLPDNKLWHVDKLLLGTLLGTIFFTAASIYSNYLKKRNFGKSYFLGQKIVLPVGTLLVLSFVMYICL